MVSDICPSLSPGEQFGPLKIVYPCKGLVTWGSEAATRQWHVWFFFNFLIYWVFWFFFLQKKYRDIIL